MVHDLSVLNSSCSPPTFVGPRGRSWIDVTIVSNKIFNDLFSWKVLSEETGSDHQYIYFEAFGRGKQQEYKLTVKGQLKLNSIFSQDKWYAERVTKFSTATLDVEKATRGMAHRLHFQRESCKTKIWTDGRQVSW